jgi:hypothetical protein
MQGILTFQSLGQALRAGYHVYDRTADGYLVRTRTPRGWALALVPLRNAA